MLTILECRTVLSATDEITERITKRIEEKKRSYLILPEQLTVTLERQMSEKLPPDAPLLFEATNFTRFANTVFRRIGGISKEHCDGAKRSLIMWRALTELSPSLEMTKGRSNIGPGYVKRALEAVGQAESLGISPTELKDALASFKSDDRRLKGKLKDLSLIYSLYKRLLSEKYQDAADDLVLLAEGLKSYPELLSDTAVFIDGFTSFTEPQYKVIRELIKKCEVFVSLNLPPEAHAAFEYKEIKNTEKRLDAIARDEKTRRFILTPEGEEDGVIRKLASLLWQGVTVADGEELERLDEDNGIIRVFAADTPFEECDFVAADILAKVMKGARFSDIAILARNAESYLGILDTALKEANIPHFLSKSEDINSLEGIKLIYTAYGIIGKGFRREDVLTYSKCGLCDLTREERDAFELYCEKWNIDGRKFFDGFEWGMSPRGYEKINADDLAQIERIEAIRERLLRPLYDLDAAIKNAKTVSDHASALLDFLLGIKMEDRLLDRAAELSRIGEVARAEECSRLWGVICECLDTLVNVLGELPADCESFINQLSVLFSEKRIGRIPAFSDEVTVGSADSARLIDKRFVYLIGVNRSEFPATVSDNSYFNDRDKLALSGCGLNIEPDLEIKNAKELYIFSRAFGYATEGVTLTYSERTAAFGEAGPSVAIGAIRDVTDGLILPKKIKELPAEKRIYSVKSALLMSKDEKAAREIADALIKSGHGESLALSRSDIENRGVNLSEDALGVLFGKDLYLSQTRIDNFLRCPMNYFCKYTLRLDEDTPAEINNPVIGTFIHSILEGFFAEVSKKNRAVFEISTEERKKLTEDCAKRFIGEVLTGNFSSARTETVIKRLCRAAEPVVDSLCEEFSACKFTPVKFELNISDKTPDTPSPVRISSEDGSVIIAGQIDRVDTYLDGDNLYVRVVDYKTGGKDFSPSDIKEGRNLQMFLYLKSIVETDKKSFKNSIGATEGKRILPAGVVYVKASVKDATVSSYDDGLALEKIKEQQERDGMLLLDDKSISAMNPDFLPFDPDNARNRARLYTEEEWDSLNKDIEGAVLKIASDIKGGKFPAIPNKKDRSCEFCRFAPVCRSAK